MTCEYFVTIKINNKLLQLLSQLVKCFTCIIYLYNFPFILLFSFPLLFYLLHSLHLFLLYIFSLYFTRSLSLLLSFFHFPVFEQFLKSLWRQGSLNYGMVMCGINENRREHLHRRVSGQRPCLTEFGIAVNFIRAIFLDKRPGQFYWLGANTSACYDTPRQLNRTNRATKPYFQ